ncbi:MAG: YjjG family noncanonical pyrimidine nucleotidase [Duncaniella sp.]|nr:YjjG family noncanonical pyrimidine nucleotidase [Duncaniella sp.]
MKTPDSHNRRKWIWFDLDDTLIDFHTNSRLAHKLLFDEQEGFGHIFHDVSDWLNAYEDHNLLLWKRYAEGEITQEFLRMDRFFTPLMTRWTRSREELETLCRYLDTHYLDLLAAQKTVIADAKETLEEMRNMGYSIGVLSNGFTSVQHRKIESAGLKSLIDCVVLSDDIGVTKPDPRLYLYAMSVVNDLDPRNHVMVGDNFSTDIRGAVAAGWGNVWFNPKGKSADLGTEGARNASIRSLSELKKVITDLF